MFHKIPNHFFLFFLVFHTADLCAKDFFMPVGFLGVTTDFHWASPSADTISGANYKTTYAQPMSFKGELGSFAVRPLYIGITFDVFRTGHIYDAGGGDITDTLTLDVLGLEIGYVFMNPRSFFIASGFVGYPLQVSVTSSTGDVYSPTNSLALSYGARAVVGVRLVPWVAVLIEGGYQRRDLGNLNSLTGVYPPGAGSMDLSGMFLSAGLGICL